MYKRVLLKMSGEALVGNERNFDPEVLKTLAREIKEVVELGIQVAIVVGGGNFIRGKTLAAMGMDRIQGDNMGMLATIINALAIQTALESEGVVTRVQTSIEVNKIAEGLSLLIILRHSEIFRSGARRASSSRIRAY